MKTICQLLAQLYRTSDNEKKIIIEECFVMAKKMNKRLSELNKIEISTLETEEAWRNDIRNS